MAAEWFTREYKCANGICVKTKFPAGGELPSARPGTRAYKRAVRRAEKNANEAKHNAAIILNNNFRAKRDHMLGLDYSDAGLDKLILRAGTDERDAVALAADREIYNWVRRVRAECRKRGVTFRCFYVTADMDGETGEEKRVHHHLVVNAEAAEICAEKWTLGGVWDRKLQGGRHGDLTAVAEYMMAQVRQIVPGKARYTATRNMEQPKVTPVRRVRNPEAELRLPKGAALIYRSEVYAGRPQYLRYYRPTAEGGGNDDDLDG